MFEVLLVAEPVNLMLTHRARTLLQVLQPPLKLNLLQARLITKHSQNTVYYIDFIICNCPSSPSSYCHIPVLHLFTQHSIVQMSGCHRSTCVKQLQKSQHSALLFVSFFHSNQVHHSHFLIPSSK